MNKYFYNDFNDIKQDKIIYLKLFLYFLIFNACELCIYHSSYLGKLDRILPFSIYKRSIKARSPIKS